MKIARHLPPSTSPDTKTETPREPVETLVETAAGSPNDDGASPGFIDRRHTVIGRVVAAADQRIIHTIDQRVQFDKLAAEGTNAGSAGMPELKFLVDTQTGEIYFIPKEFPYHARFAIEVLGVNQTEEEFDLANYGRADRRFIAGTITAYDTFEVAGQNGAYGVSFWNGDQLRAPLILRAFNAVQAAMPLAKDHLLYHPDSQMQELTLEADRGADRKALAAQGIKIFNSRDLSKNFKYSALNPGVSWGTLVIVKPGQATTPMTRASIALYEGDLPAELPPMAGVISSQPQVFLSHNALKCRQDHTPYAYDRDAHKNPDIQALAGKVVKLEVTNTGTTIVAATDAEAKAYLETLRPTADQVLKPDLSITEIRPLDRVKVSEQRAFGTKATNVAELHRLSKSGALDVSDPSLSEPAVVTPDGFGVPGALYKSFMTTALYDANTTLDEQVTKMLADPNFHSDSAYRDAKLDEFRKAIMSAQLPAATEAQLDKLQRDFAAKFPGRDMRIRSSSDSEDLQGFNGAGLFDSFTFRFKNKDKPGRSLADIFKKSFASVWNLRAYDEFEFYRIDPHSVVMSQLVMPNSDDEIANGVVRWGGGIAGGWDTMTVNAQSGEQLVTNPEAGETPDSIVVGNYGLQGETEIQYLCQTNQKLPPGRNNVLTDGELTALFKSMKVIQDHFKAVYKRQAARENKPFDEAKFFIECEFKITAEGNLLIKQARPWVG